MTKIISIVLVFFFIFAGTMSPPTFNVGTFTPTGNNVTYTATTGRYILVYPLVVITASVTMPSTADTSELRISTPWSFTNVCLGSGDVSTVNPGHIAKASGGNAYFLLKSANSGNVLLNNNRSNQTINFSAVCIL